MKASGEITGTRFSVSRLRAVCFYYFANFWWKIHRSTPNQQVFLGAVVRVTPAKESMDFHSARAMGDLYATQPHFSHLSSPVRQKFGPPSQRATLHYLPQARKQVDFNRRRYEVDVTSSCRREMDAVDEEIITRLCYALELDKLYELPDLGLTADIVNRM